jgi:hypothetical protein
LRRASCTSCRRRRLRSKSWPTRPKASPMTIRPLQSNAATGSTQRGLQTPYANISESVAAKGEGRVRPVQCARTRKREATRRPRRARRGAALVQQECYVSL